MLKAVLHTANGKINLTSQSWHGVIVERGYDAFIFDCDGTLVESAEAHFASFAAAASAQGFEFERDWYLARTGLDRVSLFRDFAQMKGDAFDIAAAVTKSISIFIETSQRVRSIPETKTLVEALATDHPLAVGTNAEDDVARASLRATGMLDCFDHVVSISNGLLPKPSPDIFTTAQQLMGVPLAQTLVIEDAVQGVTAAKLAGMDVIEIAHRSTAT